MTSRKHKSGNALIWCDNPLSHQGTRSLPHTWRDQALFLVCTSFAPYLQAGSPSLTPGDWVQASGWLIQHQERGVAQQRYGQAEAPPHAATVCTGAHAASLGQADLPLRGCRKIAGPESTQS